MWVQSGRAVDDDAARAAASNAEHMRRCEARAVRGEVGAAAHLLGEVLPRPPPSQTHRWCVHRRRPGGTERRRWSGRGWVVCSAQGLSGSERPRSGEGGAPAPHGPAEQREAG